MLKDSRGDGLEWHLVWMDTGNGHRAASWASWAGMARRIPEPAQNDCTHGHRTHVDRLSGSWALSKQGCGDKGWTNRGSGGGGFQLRPSSTSRRAGDGRSRTRFTLEATESGEDQRMFPGSESQLTRGEGGWGVRVGTPRVELGNKQGPGSVIRDSTHPHEAKLNNNSQRINRRGVGTEYTSGHHFRLPCSTAENWLGMTGLRSTLPVFRFCRPACWESVQRNHCLRRNKSIQRKAARPGINLALAR